MLTILLVDDSVHLQITFKKILSSSGYRVELAGDGEEGLRLASTVKPDVILLDMMLPKLSGVDVLLALKANRETAAASSPETRAPLWPVLSTWSGSLSQAMSSTI